MNWKLWIMLGWTIACVFAGIAAILQLDETAVKESGYPTADHAITFPDSGASTACFVGDVESIGGITTSTAIGDSSVGWISTIQDGRSESEGGIYTFTLGRRLDAGVYIIGAETLKGALAELQIEYLSKRNLSDEVYGRRDR